MLKLKYKFTLFKLQVESFVNKICSAAYSKQKEQLFCQMHAIWTYLQSVCGRNIEIILQNTHTKRQNNGKEMVTNWVLQSIWRVTGTLKNWTSCNESAVPWGEMCVFDYFKLFY